MVPFWIYSLQLEVYSVLCLEEQINSSPSFVFGCKTQLVKQNILNYFSFNILPLDCI